MGDILVSSVIFESLKKNFPDAELHYLISQEYEQIVAHNQFIDKIIFFGDLFPTLWRLRKEKYDVVVDSYAKLESALLAFLSGAKKEFLSIKNIRNESILIQLLDRTKQDFRVLLPLWSIDYSF